MSFTGTMAAADEAKIPSSWLRDHRGAQFAIAVAGALISWRESSPRFIQLPSAPPADFTDRLILAGPPLLGLGLCMAFMCWGALLFSQYSDRSKPRLADTVHSASKRKPPLWFTLPLFGALAVAATLSWGAPYLRFIWPLRADGILHAANVANLVVSIGVLLAGVRRKRTQTSPQAFGGDAQDKFWVDRRQGQFIIATVAGVVILGAIGRLGRIYFPEHLHLFMRVSAIALSAFITGVFTIKPKKSETAERPVLDAERLNTTPASEVRGSFSVSNIVSCVTGIFTAGAWLLPIDPYLKVALAAGPVGLLMVLGAVLSRVRRRIMRLAKQGDYDEALRVDKQFSRFPYYGTPLEGTILFQAGRYAEAQGLLKPQAYDRSGQPKRTGMPLYIYALALTNGGRAAEAEKLLDGAVNSPQTSGVFHVALATCLLSQEKDPQRALQLIEQSMTNWPVTTNDYEGRADQMRRFGRLAWALAASGRSEDAKAKLQQAFAGAVNFRGDDMAGLQYFAGETWRVIGDSTRARAAFNEALRLAVPGSAPATSAKKGLAKLAYE